MNPHHAIEPPQNRDRQEANRPVYLITFGCYGTWLPGQAGAVNRNHNRFGSRLREADPVEEQRARRRMLQPAYYLDEEPRQIVLEALQQVCSHRQWTLLAAHVRTNHVHAVLEADKAAEQVMNVFKSYASRALNQSALDPAERRRWAHHGSTRHLWTRDAVTAAVHYVVSEQGEAMAVWELPSG